MAAAKTDTPAGGEKPGGDKPGVKPYVPAHVTDVAEFTWSAVLLGTVLGIVFAASSMYLVLKVGMTVSASIPIAVLSVSLFRGLAALTRIPLFPSFLRLRRATILENNIVQTTGSAGESIAFGVGVTMPALMLLGFEMDLYRVMTVGVLGGLLGILMMIPLRRAFIVKQHGELTYPEGTACAEVLKAGERGGASAAMVFLGFAVASLAKFLMNPLKVVQDHASWALYRGGNGQPVVGLNKGVLGGEFTPELLGVGFVIGPKIASITVAGGVLAYLAIVPTIAMFGEGVPVPIYPSESALIRDMSENDIRNFYILYIGAGAVATGGVISMARAMPVILSSIVAGLQDLLGTLRSRSAKDPNAVPRTDRDLSMGVVFAGSALLILLLALSPNLGLGLSLQGLLGASLVVVFGFLFVTVSSRLTGEIGSSSNPISGMTVATLLLTCLIFLALGKTSKADTLTALTIAAVVCISASNGGTTSQDLKTGFLVGGTPRLQQIGILIGALTSALVIGATIKLVNDAGTHYTRNPAYLPKVVLPAEKLQQLTQTQRVGRPYAEEDSATYRVLLAAQGEMPGLAQGKYLVDDQGTIRYREDPAINGLLEYDDKQQLLKDRKDRGESVVAVSLPKYDAPKTKLMALIIDGILNQKLPWSLVLIGALLSITLELCGVPSLPFAVGIYLPIQVSFPIFLGGMMRWVVDQMNPRSSDSSDSSPGVLLCSGYIAGGSIVGVLGAFLNFRDDWVKQLDLSQQVDQWFGPGTATNPWNTVGVFAVLYGLLFVVGTWGWRKRRAEWKKEVAKSKGSQP